MPAKRSIRALDNAQSNGRQKSKFMSSSEPCHQQQPPETPFHGHNLRSRRQTPSDAQQISRKDQAVIQKEPEVKCQQAGTSRKDHTVVRTYPKEKYKHAGTSRKDRTDIRKDPKEKCEEAHTSRKDRAIIRKRSRGKRETPHTIEPAPKPPSISESPVPLTKETLRLLNRNTENSKSSNMVSGDSESATSEAQFGSINTYDPEYRNALEDRDIFFADGKDPPLNFHELWEAMIRPRGSPRPDDIEAENFRAQLTDANNESASVKDILPRLVPLMSLQLEKDTAYVKDQLWHRDVALQPELKPTLTTPKPDVTIGWKPEVFKSRYKKAYKSLQAFISPIAGFRSVAWPILTIEARGDRWSMRVARLQNLHNGAIMLSNLFELKRKCGNEEDFFNKVHVIDVELTAESVQLSCYWSCRNNIGGVECFGKRLQCWSLFDETGDSLRNARRGIRNVV